ncbi:hypothetical protein [Acinetobacter sp. YH16055]|uniref:hypothetical protein n=1 Tax=Acinetobacter sp. YH16055 TaxID=2601193 RepID=UPI0015D42F14|nr:hypothetical protein [Acinetobacter sp. YH16055]
MKLNLDRFNLGVMFLMVVYTSLSVFVISISPLLRYIFPFLMVILIPLNILHYSKNKRNWFLFYFIILIYMIISLMDQKIISSLLGVYVFITIFFSASIKYEILLKFLSAKFFWVLIFLCNYIGLFYVDSFGSIFQGVEYETFGSTKNISKDWTASGVNRNPGFTESSITVAALLLISGTLFLGEFIKKINLLNIIIFIIIFGLMLHGLFLSTTKTMIATAIIVLLIFFIKNKFKFIVLQILTFFYLPISYYYLFFGEKDYLGNNTLFIRFYETWPDSFKLLNSLLDKTFGSGFGSIGSPLMLKGSSAYPADNFLVYLYINFGVVSLIFAVYFLLNILKIKKIYWNDNFLLIYVILLMGCLTYNIVELPIYSIFLGAILLSFFKKYNN